MIFSKIWNDLRFRFYFSLCFVSGTALFLVMLYAVAPFLMGFLKGQLPPQDYAELQVFLGSYRLFMDEGWFREVQFIAFFGILMSLGGILPESRTPAILLTLSLPVRRRAWILSHAGIVMILVAILVASASFIILLGGWIGSESYPVFKAIGGMILLTLGCFAWVGPTFAVASVTLDRWKTALIVLSAWFVINTLDRLPSIHPWLPGSLLDSLNDGLTPWKAFVTIAIFGAGGLLVAVHRFEKQDV